MASNVGTFYSVWVRVGGWEGGQKGDLLLPPFGGSGKKERKRNKT